MIKINTLHTTKRKNDVFYTQLTDIEQELKYHNVMKIPHWEFQYIFGGEDFPNSEIRDFYGFFKKEFLKGNPIDVGGYSNYYFFLLFDLIKDKVANLETHLKRLMDYYPQIIPYCEEEMSKLGIVCRKYNGEDYIRACYLYDREAVLERIIGSNISQADIDKFNADIDKYKTLQEFGFMGNIVCDNDGEKIYSRLPNIYVVNKDFKNKDKILTWLHTSEFSVNGCNVYVNSKGIIDVIQNDERLYGKTKRGIILKVFTEQLPEYVQFGVVEGNVKFTNNGWSSELNMLTRGQGVYGEILPHKITILRGCPKIVKGDFIAENVDIDSLIGGPQIVEGDFIVKRNMIKSFEGMPQYIGGLFNISNNELTDDAWDYAKDNIEGEFGDYNIKKNKFVKYRKELY